MKKKQDNSALIVAVIGVFVSAQLVVLNFAIHKPYEAIACLLVAVSIFCWYSQRTISNKLYGILDDTIESYESLDRTRQGQITELWEIQRSKDAEIKALHERIMELQKVKVKVRQG